MKCPKCGHAMAELSVGDVPIDRCGGCGGIWLDGTESEKIRALAGSESIDVPGADVTASAIKARQGEPPNITCPRCSRRMMILMVERTPPLYFENCGRCNGVFLDGGELRAMKQATLDEWLRATLPGIFKLQWPSTE